MALGMEPSLGWVDKNCAMAINFDNRSPIDWSPYKNNGSFVGSPVEVAGVKGKGAIQFNGSSQYTQTNYVLPTTNFSIAIWAKSSTAALTNRPLGAAHADVGTNGVAIIWGFSNGLYVVARNNSTSYDLNLTPPTSITSGWHHIVIIVDSVAGLKIYYDGKQLGANASGTAITTGNLTLRFGAEAAWGASPSYFNGIIDDAFIFNRVLSIAEVRELYEQGVA